MYFSITVRRFRRSTSCRLAFAKPVIHAIVAMHGEEGPWSNRPGFDEIGAAVSWLFTIEVPRLGRSSRQLSRLRECVSTTGILAALRRRAIEGGSYRVVVSLTRTVCG